MTAVDRLDLRISIAARPDRRPASASSAFRSRVGARAGSVSLAAGLSGLVSLGDAHDDSTANSAVPWVILTSARAAAEFAGRLPYRCDGPKARRFGCFRSALPLCCVSLDSLRARLDRLEPDRQRPAQRDEPGRTSRSTTRGDGIVRGRTRGGSPASRTRSARRVNPAPLDPAGRRGFTRVDAGRGEGRVAGSRDDDPVAGAGPAQLDRRDADVGPPRSRTCSRSRSRICNRRSGSRIARPSRPANPMPWRSRRKPARPRCRTKMNRPSGFVR